MVSNTVPASCHDKRMADDMAEDVDEQDQAMGDAGYIGLDVTWGIGVWTPRTRPRNGSLSRYESTCNGILQAVRNAVEHVIGDMKNTVGALSYNVRDADAESFVNSLWYFASALHNFKIWDAETHEETIFATAVEPVFTLTEAMISAMEEEEEEEDGAERRLPSVTTMAARVRAANARRRRHEHEHDNDDYEPEQSDQEQPVTLRRPVNVLRSTLFVLVFALILLRELGETDDDEGAPL